MPQVLKRLPNGLFQITDHELTICCSGCTSYGTAVLIGTAFLSRSNQWRCLRMGFIDVGHEASADAAIERLLQDHARHDIDPQTAGVLPI